MQIENRIVHGLWIGTSLSPVELLCIKSFQANGHEFHLWVYDAIETTLPENTVIEDASKIIPRENVFCYKYSNQFGHGKGSYAGFSDIFRYKLLYEYGGWWVDMDVVCLKPLDFKEPFVFRTHHDFRMVGNVMKCEKESQLMQLCYERACLKVNEYNLDWNLPIQILNNTVFELKMEKFIREFTNPDSWLLIRKLLFRKYKLPDEWYALHLVNEEWRRNRINKNAIPKKSQIGILLRNNNCYVESSRAKRIITVSRVFFIRFSFMQATGLANKLFWKAVRLIKNEKKV